jgi:branched-chain amino acid transport system permease protein
MRHLEGRRGSGDAGTTGRLAVRRELPTLRGWWIIAVVALSVPLLMAPANLRLAQQVPALAIILVSIVVLSGYGGQISLGQAGFAGLGALFAAKLASGGLGPLPEIPALLAVPVGALLVVPVGMLTSWVAIRRRGLFLALTTFAVGAVISRFVFAQPALVSGVQIAPPPLVSGDESYYVYELAGLAGALIVVRNLHRGRLGRALVAIRDSEAGALASGIDVHRRKLFVFGVAAALAGFGGVLLAASYRAFDAGTYDPIRSLVWFAAVVVFGVDSAAGAVLGAGILIGLDVAFGEGVATIAVGLFAVMLGHLPGGLLYTVRRVVTEPFLRRRPAPEPAVRLSPAGTALASRVRR